MKVTRILVLIVLATSGCKNPTSSPTDHPQPQSSARSYTIDDVIATIESSNARFEYIIDDKMHVANGPQMAQHLREKFFAAGRPEITPEKFIKRYATFSDGETAKYRVRLPDGSHYELAEWLRMQMSR